jgi:hypothetical protein
MKYRVEARYGDVWETAGGKRGPATGLSKEEAQERADSLRLWLKDVRIVEDVQAGPTV